MGESGSFTLPELVRSGTLAQASAPLFATLLHLLERHGAADEGESGWRLGKSDMPAPARIWRTLLDAEPRMVADLALSAAAVSRLAQLLRHGPEAVTPLPAALL